MAGQLSIGKAWGEAAAFVRRERRLIAPVVLALIVVPAVIAELIKPSSAVGTQPEPGGWSLVVLASLLIGMIGQLAIMRLAMGWDAPIGGALKLAFRRFWSALGALFLFGLMFGLAVIPLVVIMALVSGGDARVMTGRITLLLIVVIFAAMPRILPLTAVAMASEGGPWRLLKETFRLTRGNYGRLLGFFLLFLVASFALAAAVTIAFGSAAALLIGPPEPMSVSRLIVALAGGLVQGVVLSLYAAMTGRITLQLLAESSEGSSNGT
ncbi:MAG: hypothetical protein LH465_06105 [Sphingomonas bacterium]|nr:hypothetical protein [Sphingomonas bacterium]